MTTILATFPSAFHNTTEMAEICERRRVLSQQIRSADPQRQIPMPIFVAALRLAAKRSDVYDAIAHVRCLHETVDLRPDWLEGVLAASNADLNEVARMFQDDLVWATWALACTDAAVFEVLRSARRALRGRS